MDEPHDRNPTKRELQHWRDSFRRWQAPDAFGRLVDACRGTWGPCLLAAAGAEFWRKAWAAAMLARLRGAQEVRLEVGPRPDFALKVGNELCRYEFTEAIQPGRRRGDEINRDRRARGDGPILRNLPEERVLTPELAGRMLRAAACRKCDDRYDSGWGLVIYLGGYIFDACQEIEAVLVDATAPAGQHFAEVWVIRSDRACNTWLRGAPQATAFASHAPTA